MLHKQVYIVKKRESKVLVTHRDKKEPLTLVASCAYAYKLLVLSDIFMLVKQSTNSNSKSEFYGRNIKKNHPLLYCFTFINELYTS